MCSKALHVLTYYLKKTFRDDEFQSILELLKAYKIVAAGIGTKAKAVADLSFFYWHKEILSVYFANICKHPTEASSLQVK